MDRTTAVFATVAAGGLIAFQAPINGRLGREVGAVPAATVSFLIASVALLALVTLRGEAGRITEAPGAPWWALTGGLLGAGYVTTIVLTVGTLGAGGVVAATIAAQLTVSLAIDQFGWAGATRDPITPVQLLGVLLLVAGVVLIVRE